MGTASEGAFGMSEGGIRSSQLSSDAAMSAASSTSAARKVFEIPELLEKILLDEVFNVEDLLPLTRVSRCWRSTFEGSKKLLTKAQLIADIEDKILDFQNVWKDELGVIINRQADFVDGEVHFELFFCFDEFVPIQLTTNIRQCFATIPPCEKMKVTPRCCEDDEEVISREGGLKMGDVVDAARRTYAEHEHCPEMVQFVVARSQALHHTNQSRYPVFHGVAHIPENHPLRIEEAEKNDRIKRETEIMKDEFERMGWGDTWHEYEHARETGKLNEDPSIFTCCSAINWYCAAAANDDPLPRWPEFLVKNRHLAPPGYKLSIAEIEAASRPRHPVEAPDDGSFSEVDNDSIPLSQGESGVSPDGAISQEDSWDITAPQSLQSPGSVIAEETQKMSIRDEGYSDA